MLETVVVSTHQPKRSTAMPGGNEVHWLVESLRLTVFTTTGPDPAGIPGSWKAVVGEDPDVVESKPKELLHQEAGPFREGVLTFRCLPQRIDWIVHPSTPIEGALTTIGRFEGEILPFVKLMKNWLSESQEIMRLAFGAILLDPVSDRKEGYEKLSRYLPLTVDSDARNFMYQINRRCSSQCGSSGLEINRLSKWSCLEQHTEHIFVSGGATVNAGSPSLFAVRLEVDINTVPECAELIDQSGCGDLLDELVDFGREIANKGDIR